MNFSFLLCGLSCFICYWHSLHAKIWKGTTFSVSTGVDVHDATPIAGYSGANVSEFECRILCLQILDCIAFVITQITGCQIYSNFEKLVRLSTAKLYLIGDQPLSIEVPEGNYVTLHGGLAFVVLDKLSADWNASYDKCFQLKGFRLVMPKTQMQYDYLVSQSGSYSSIALDLHVNATGVFFGDGTPFENSEISGETITKDEGKAATIPYRSSLGGLDDLAYTSTWGCWSLCESNIFGNFTNY